jgi:hypothetical protein
MAKYWLCTHTAMGKHVALGCCAAYRLPAPVSMPDPLTSALVAREASFSQVNPVLST